MIPLKLVRNDYPKAGKVKDFLYQRKGAAYKNTEPLPEAEVYTICAEFKDGTPSYASVSVNGRGASAVAGYTACGTGRKRKAAFLFKPEACTKDVLVEVFGMPDLVEIGITPGRDEDFIGAAIADRVKPGEVKPPFELKKPLQLVNTAGTDSPSREGLKNALESMRELLPYIKSLGFNGVESYVKWNFVEYEKGKYDWSYYDAVIALAAEYGMHWFPLIIGGSAYALPEWFREGTPGFKGFVCLEHGMENNVPTIFNDHQTPYVVDYLHELGRHYEGNKNVFGIRLGPSGNYGESQYPASGNWGYKGMKEHMHIGWWAGDESASVRFQQWLREKYGDVAALNSAWKEEYESFEEVKTFLPSSTNVKRKRKDFVDWYMWEMTNWCNKWGVWVRDELKSHDIFQSAGGWGLCECGTDFTDQTKGMVPIDGGIRATNEDESYELNFAITRMLSSAARFYGVKFGSEPAGYGTARSVINRLFNIIVNNGQHLFYYHGNFTGCDESAERWLKYAPLLDERSEPVIDVAVLYPDTLSKLSDSSIRYLDGSSFFSQVFPLRRKLDYDFCSEHMILDGALEKNGYKALVFLSRGHDGDFVEAEALEKIDAYVRNGGTVIYPIIRSNAAQGPHTVEDDNSVYMRWLRGDTGKGKVILINTMREPLDAYIDDIAEELIKMENLNPLTRDMLKAEKKRGVYMSALKTGKLVIYNDLMEDTDVVLPDGKTVSLEPVSIKVVAR